MMRILHLTTEYPPVIYGGLGTAVGGWVKASARGGLAVGVLLVEGPLVLDEDDDTRYGGFTRALEHVQQPSTVTDREGVTLVRNTSWVRNRTRGWRTVRRRKQQSRKPTG